MVSRKREPVSKELIEEIRKYDEDIGGNRLLQVYDNLLEIYPEVMAGYWTQRRAVLMGPEDGGLPRRMKELIIVAIQIALRMPGGGASHARNAIRLGATPKQVCEAVSLAFMITGISTFVTSGHKALDAAVEEEKKVKEKK